jgi:DNA-binding CsgD family transcriptional regulator
MFRPLMTAVESGRGIIESVTVIVHGLGFENFMYGASASPRLDHESQGYLFTTHSRDWVRRYDEQAYIEVDTRITRALDSALPLVWDYASERGHSPQTDALLEDSLAHGVGSGVMCGIHGPRETRVIYGLSNASPCIDPHRRQEIEERMGNILLLGTYFHEIFMKSVVEQGIPPPSRGVPLSAREKQCLTLAAQGQTTQDMALQLGVSERTIQFHFDGIRGKLGAANRPEAVAKAIAAGLVKSS